MEDPRIVTSLRDVSETWATTIVTSEVPVKQCPRTQLCVIDTLGLDASRAGKSVTPFKLIGQSRSQRHAQLSIQGRPELRRLCRASNNVKVHHASSTAQPDPNGRFFGQYNIT